jgi:cobalt-zinc-cadmium efflux system outer membrane protein
MSFPSVRHRGVLSGAVLALLLSTNLLAQTPLRALTLSEALTRSAKLNPELAVLDFEVDAQEGRVRQAGAHPAPEVGVLVENAFGSGARSGFDAAETTLSIGYAIERGARERRLDVANAGSLVLGADIQIRRLDVAAETARRYLDVLSTQSHVEQTRIASELGGQSLQAVHARVRAAKVPPAEEARAQAQLARLKLDEEHAEHELLTARQRLAAMWGSLEPDFEVVNGNLLVLPALESFEKLRPRLQGNPLFARFVNEKRLRESEVRMAEMRRRPPWHVTAGVRRFEDLGDHAFILGVTVPLSSPSTSSGARAEARANSDAVGAKESATRIQLDVELFALYQELRHAYAEVETLRTEVLPKMEEAARQSRYAYERGRYSYVEWAGAQREFLDAQRTLHEAAADAHRLRIEIERLTGTALSGNTIP